MSCNECKKTEIGKIPVSWNYAPMKDYVEINMGQSPKSEFYNTDGEGLPFLQGNRTFGLKYPYYDTYTSEIKKRAQEGDILFSVRAPVGDVNIATEEICIGRGIASLKMKNGSQNYLYYLLRGYRKYIENRESGTVFGSINKKGLEELKLPFPPLEEQEKIANILSSLDDKIELNNEMNKTLEEMAQSLFKRWFVDFEFPNDDGEPYKSSGGEMVESELGMIPKGWKVTELGDVVDSISVKHKFPNDKIIFLNTSDILDGEILHNDYSEVESLPGQAKKSIKKGDILYSEIRPKNKRFAYINFDADEYVVSTKLMVLRAKNNINPAMVYFYLTSEGTINYLQMLAESRSGTFPQITFSQVKDIKVAIPKGELLVRLGEVFETLLNSIWNNKIEIKELSELRDSLLPKLMNGEIRVK